MADLGTQPTMTIGPVSAGAVFADRYEIRGLLGEGGMGAVYRALDRDSTIGQTYHVIAVVRTLNGEHRNALAAARESIRRNPLEVGSHSLIGEILCHVGRTAEGLQRLDLATRFDPGNPHPSREKTLALALSGDRDGAMREIKRIEETGPAAAVLARMRLFSWWRDRDMARTTAELIRKYASGASWEAAVPMMAGFAEGNIAEPFAALVQAIPYMTSERVIPRHRSLMFQIVAEFTMLADAENHALAAIEGASRLSNFIDLNWLDRCPLFESIRDEARFAAARAAIAERVSQILE